MNPCDHLKERKKVIPKKFTMEVEIDLNALPGRPCMGYELCLRGLCESEGRDVTNFPGPTFFAKLVAKQPICSG